VSRTSASGTGAGAVRPARAPSARARVVDVALIAMSVAWGWVATSRLGPPAGAPDWFGPVDTVLGVLACLALWWRREHPVAVGVVLVTAGTALASVSVAPLIALYAVATLASVRATAVLGVLNLLAFAPQVLLRPDMPASPTLLVASHVVGVVAAAAAGLVVRSRRQLIRSLRERADAAEVEAALRAAQAQHEAREQLAREMHDVLGHRLSLLSVQAGALSYNRESAPEDAARAMEEIRRSAHQALQDLREVIGVLRSRPDDVPAPDVSDIPALVHEAGAPGAPVRLDDGTGLTRGGDEAPAIVGRTLYRFVQEALTNVRRHAPGASAVVRISGERGGAVEAEVLNGAGGVPSPAAEGATRAGLRGLRERAALVGGRLEHGPTRDGGWRLAIRLPWPS